MTAVEVNHIVKSFSGKTAVNDLSFSVTPGEIVGLIGPLVRDVRPEGRLEWYHGLAHGAPLNLNPLPVEFWRFCPEVPVGWERLVERFHFLKRLLWVPVRSSRSESLSVV